MASDLTPEEIARRLQKQLEAIPTIIAETVGEKPKRKKKMSRRKRRIGKHPLGKRALCLQRRKGKGKTRRCNSLFYADCLKSNGTTKKTERCKTIAKSKLSYGNHRL